jgi:hypothetical protein
MECSTDSFNSYHAYTVLLQNFRRMVYSGMFRRVALVISDVWVEPSAKISVARIGELGTALAATSNRRTLMKEALDSSETSVLTRATRRNIPEDTILHSHRRYIQNFTFTFLDIIQRPVFYLKHVMNFRTSQETHYVSATIPTIQCDLRVCNVGVLI